MRPFRPWKGQGAVMALPAMGPRRGRPAGLAIAGPARWRRAALGALALCATAVFQESLGFVAAPGSVVRSAAKAASENVAPWVSGSSVERMEVPRSESEPKTLMRGRYKEGDRSRYNQQGGGRLPINVNRKPSMAYAIAAEEPKERGAAVLRRMWDMYDMDFHKMTAMRQRYFRPGYRDKKWVADYNMRLGRRSNKNKVKRKLEDDWMEWMRTEGRSRGYQDPVIFKGPPMAHALTPEMDKDSDPETYKKRFPSEQDIQKFLDDKPKKPPMERVPKWTLPGQFPERDAPDNIFNIWKRPLHRYPFDIGKRGKRGHYVRGNVV